ncbi:hypothetical protein C4K39_6150 [Pseudomonas sessilinigenes]|nr:hypothetical protein C4K39_6150 [Pseudomonas sessilinigenes]
MQRRPCTKLARGHPTAVSGEPFWRARGRKQRRTQENDLGL